MARSAIVSALGKADFKPRSDDLFQERLYAIQWMRPKKKGRRIEFRVRSVTPEDLKRERIVEGLLAKHIGRLADERLAAGHANRDRRATTLPRTQPNSRTWLDTLAPPVQPTAVVAWRTDQSKFR